MALFIVYLLCAMHKVRCFICIFLQRPCEVAMILNHTAGEDNKV